MLPGGVSAANLTHHDGYLPPVGGTAAPSDGVLVEVRHLRDMVNGLSVKLESMAQRNMELSNCVTTLEEQARDARATADQLRMDLADERRVARAAEAEELRRSDALY